MPRFWKRRSDSPIESLLAANRPVPPDEFVAAVVERVETQQRRPGVRTSWRRVVLAAVVTALAVGVAAAAGGVTSASNGVGRLVNVAKKTIVSPQANWSASTHGNQQGVNQSSSQSANQQNGSNNQGGSQGRSPADAQYAVTVCHHTESATNPWVENTVSAEAAVNLVINHPPDFIVTQTSPCPPGSTPIDLAITKAGSPSSVTVGSPIIWTITVTNIGSNVATGVIVADAIPAGTTFDSANASQGTCAAAGGVLVTCQIGDVANGATVTITLKTTVDRSGSITNTATVVGPNEAETDPANNTAAASVKAKGAFQPPVVYCTAVAVSPKSLSVGRMSVLTMRVSQHGKATAGVRVKIKGSTLNILTEPSNAKGVVTRSVKPMKAGIVTFIPVAQKSCKNPRIGVIGAFTPAVTG